MKNKFRYSIAILSILASVVAPATAAAVPSRSSSGAGETIADVQKKYGRSADRITKFKAKYKVKLTVAQIDRIKHKCVNAQSLVGKLRNRFGEKAKPRTAAYTNLQKRLDDLVIKLKAKNVNTSDLEQQIAELKTKIETFNTDLTAYQQALTDLKEVACKSDPDGFQAVLLAARAAHDTLLSDIQAIKTYLKDTLRPTLQSIKQDLEGQAANKEEPGTDADNEDEGSN